MKKTTFLAIAAFVVVAFTSCKKDRTCTCTSSSTSTQAGFVASPADTQTQTLTKSKKKNAELYCQSSTRVTSYPANGSTPAYTTTSTSTCTLK